jgi:signal transduction histidine kinase
VLSIAKIEAGHVALSESDFDLGALVHGVRDLLTSRARAKGLALVLEESGELPRCAATRPSCAR